MVPVTLNRMPDRRERRNEGDAERDDAQFWERSRDSVLKARVTTGLVVTGAAGGVAGLTWLAVTVI
jgi:hypothetical protein